MDNEALVQGEVWAQNKGEREPPSWSTEPVPHAQLLKGQADKNRGVKEIRARRG